MMITQVTIDGHEGKISIERNENGAVVMAGKVCIAFLRRDEHELIRHEKTVEVAKAVYGTGRRGRPAATNSMVSDVYQLLGRLAD